jgi:hypothetical protein
VIQEQTLCSLPRMAASQSAATYSHTRLLQGFCFAKDGARRELRRSRTHQVCPMLSLRGSEVLRSHYNKDMPEKEATYIITNGGINDPEKV